MEYDKLKIGAYVRVTSSQETFEGKVKHWDASKHLLTIDSGTFNMGTFEYGGYGCDEFISFILALNLNTKKNLGLLKFYHNDIDYLQVLEDSRSSDSNNNSITNNNENGYVSSDNEYRVVKARSSVSSRANESVISSKSNTNGNNNGLTIDDLQQFPYLLIVDINSAINVMDGLMNSKCVGFRLYGEFKRSGKISLICITCKKEAYLFDFLSIINEYDENEMKFMNLLNKLLSDSSIVKVIHDSRFVSDMLYHQYEIDFKNVFDVQVAYLTIYKENFGKYPINTVTIEKMINEFYPEEIRLNQLISTNDVSNYERINWLQRPLSTKMKFISLYQTMPLIDMRDILYEKLLQRFRISCDLYLSIIRDCTNTEKINELYNNKDKTPIELEKVRVPLSTENENVTKKTTPVVASNNNNNNHANDHSSQITVTKSQINSKPINRSMPTGFGDVKQEKQRNLSYGSDYDSYSNMNGDSTNREDSSEKEEIEKNKRLQMLEKIRLYPAGFTTDNRPKRNKFSYK